MNNDELRRAVTWLLNDCEIKASDLIERFGEDAIDVLVDEFSMWLDEVRNKRRDVE